jgi:SAM-dependent methyltransferase
MLRSLITEIARGKSLSRTLINFHCASIDLQGDGIDLGSKDGSASHYRFLKTDRAKITYSDIKPQKPDVIKMDLTRPFPIESDSQDFLLLFHVLEHLPDPSMCLQEACRILKPGGRLIGAVPFLHRVHPDPDDYFRYTSSALSLLAERAGFAESKIDAIGVGPNTAALNTLLGFVKTKPLKAAAVVCAILADRALGLVTRKSWVDVYPMAYVFKMKSPEG